MALKTVFYTTQKREYIAQLTYERDGRVGRGYYVSICACDVVEMPRFGWSFKTRPFDGTYSAALLFEVSRAGKGAEERAREIFPAWCEAYFSALGESADQCTAAEAAGMRARRMEREEAEGAAKTA